MFDYGRAVCYSGYRAGQSPATKIYPEIEQIKEDLLILEKKGFKYLRMYDPVIYAENVCKVIRELNLDMKLMLGAGLCSEVNNPNCPWLKTDYSQEELEKRAEFNNGRIEELIRIANTYSDVINIVSIGNENTPSWGENMVPVPRLIEFAKRLKAGTGKPVTFNEGAFEWPLLTDLAEYMDIICVHSYPLWYGNTAEEALEVNKTWYKKIKDLYPNKPVWFSEVGWSTSAVDYSQMKEGQACVEQAQKYYDAFLPWIDEEKIISYLFEAFDEPWKGGNNPAEAEKHWGIFNEDRTQKIKI
ncbi:MAG: glycosyl hydrolase family 17 protein [Treponema sp.]|nr:glycosyl hydrolase family 17 protein [Treponema sp.]